MPRQNTRPSEFPPAILLQITQLAQRIVTQRKSLGETQAQWAAKLGISQPTMARIERGDPAVAMATYVSCLWQLNPELDLSQLLTSAPASRLTCTSDSVAASAGYNRATTTQDLRIEPRIGTQASIEQEQQAQIERNFGAAKAALDFFKSPLF